MSEAPIRKRRRILPPGGEPTPTPAASPVGQSSSSSMTSSHASIPISTSSTPISSSSTQISTSSTPISTPSPEPINHISSPITSISSPSNTSQIIQPNSSSPFNTVTAISTSQAANASSAVPPPPKIRKRKVIPGAPSSSETSVSAQSSNQLIPTISNSSPIPSPTVSATPSTPAIQSVQPLPFSDEIPDIDLNNLPNEAPKKRVAYRSTQDNSLFYATGDDDNLDDPEFDKDLSKLGNFEMRQELIKANTQDAKESFEERMKSKEEQYSKTKTNGTFSSNLHSFNQQQQQNELDKLLTQNLNDLKKFTTSFEPSVLNLSVLKCDESAPLFSPEPIGFCRQFSQTVETAIEGFIEEKAGHEFDLNSSAKRLGLLSSDDTNDYITDGVDSRIPEVNYMEQIQNSIEKMKGMEQVLKNINLKSPSGHELLIGLSQILMAGIKVSAQQFFTELVDCISNNSQQQTINLQTTIIHVDNNISEIGIRGDRINYTFIMIHDLIKDKLLGQLFREILKLTQFRANHYFIDSPMIDFSLVKKVATIAQTIDNASIISMTSLEITGIMKLGVIPDRFSPSSNQWMERIHGTVRGFYKQVKQDLLEDVDLESHVLNPISEIVTEVCRCILTDVLGNEGKLENMWNLITAASDSQRVAKYPGAAEFRDMVAKRKGIGLSSTKVIGVLTDLLNNKIFHMITLYCHAGQPDAKGFESAGLIACELDCIKIASELAFLNDFSFSVKAEQLKDLINL